MSNKIREVFDQIETRMQEHQSAIPDDIPLIELGKVKLSPAQQRMFIEMLPFVAPKLSAVAHLREGDGFAERLERAIARRDRAELIEGRAERGEDR